MRSPQPSQPCTRRQSWRSSSEPNWPSAMNCCASFTSRHGSSVPKPKLSLNGSESSEGVSGARMELAGDTRQADRPARPRPAPRPRAPDPESSRSCLVSDVLFRTGPGDPHHVVARDLVIYIYHILYEFRAGQPQPKGTHSRRRRHGENSENHTATRQPSRAAERSQRTGVAVASGRAGWHGICGNTNRTANTEQTTDTSHAMRHGIPRRHTLACRRPPRSRVVVSVRPVARRNRTRPD